MNNELPKSWALASVEDVCSYIQRGKSPKYAAISELPVINQRCIRWWGVDSRYLKFIDKRQWSELAPERFLQSGDILWNSTGTGTIGRACIYAPLEGYERCVVDSHVTILRVAKGIWSQYFFYFVMSPQTQKRITDMQTGSTNQVELPRSEICSTQVPLPPEAEQARIVSRIDELFSSIDEGERALERARRLVERYRQSMLKAAVTGELTREWREQHAGELESGEALLTRILEARRKAWETAELAKMTAKKQRPSNDLWKKRYKEPVEPDSQLLPDLPCGWIWASLDMISHLTGGITVDQKRDKEGTSIVPYLRVANVQRGYLDLTEMKTIAATERDIEQLALVPGDILFNEGGDLDKLGRGWIWEGQYSECIHQNHVFRARLYLRGDWSKIISWYSNVIGKQIFQALGKHTTNLASLSLTKLKSFAVPIMSASEAEEIINKVDSAESVLSRESRDLITPALLSSSLRQSVLRNAFSGELVLQDPSDEPASVLLERIAAQRAAAASEASAAREGKSKSGFAAGMTNKRAAATATPRKPKASKGKAKA